MWYFNGHARTLLQAVLEVILGARSACFGCTEDDLNQRDKLQSHFRSVEIPVLQERHMYFIGMLLSFISGDATISFCTVSACEAPWHQLTLIVQINETPDYKARTMTRKRRICDTRHELRMDELRMSRAAILTDIILPVYLFIERRIHRRRYPFFGSGSKARDAVGLAELSRTDRAWKTFR